MAEVAVTDVAEAIRRFLVEDLDLALGGDIDYGTPLIEEQILDSLAIVEVVGFMESEFELVLDRDDVVIDNFGTIGDMARLVERKLV